MKIEGLSLKRSSFYKYSLIIIVCVYLQGCMKRLDIPSPNLRCDHALKLSNTVGWQAHTIHTSQFALKVYRPSKILHGDTLRIYIEGDGFAWRDSETPSDNPTPITPLALQLAIKDRNYQRVAYLARPCQYVSGIDWGACREDYWTNLRFAPEVIDAMDQAVSTLKKQWQANKITLIGYSGGGAIALLVAARRSDVATVMTVAGVLDTQSWSRELGLLSLKGSLNPADQWQKLAVIPQTHWVGQNDNVVPIAIAKAYARRFPPDHKPIIKVMPHFNHACCWAKDWLTLMKQSTLHRSS